MQGPVSPPGRLISPYQEPHRSGRDWPWRQVSFDPAPVKRPSTEPCARRRPASDAPCSFTASISPFAPGLHRVQEHVERRNLQHVLVLVLVVLVTVVVIVVTVVVLSCAPPFPTTAGQTSSTGTVTITAEDNDCRRPRQGVDGIGRGDRRGRRGLAAPASQTLTITDDENGADG